LFTAYEFYNDEFIMKFGSRLACVLESIDLLLALAEPIEAVVLNMLFCKFLDLFTPFPII